MKKRYKPTEVDYMFGGVSSVSEEFRVIIAKAISKLPRKIVDWTTENLLFVSSSEEYWAFSLSQEEWKHKKGFVFLSEHLRNKSDEKQAFWIAHEIAHQYLKHRSPIFSNLTKENAQKQEEEADELAEKWLS